MGEGFKNWLATASSSKFILFIVLSLILVSGFASVLIQNGSNWFSSSSSSSFSSFSSSFSSSSNTTLNRLNNPSSQAQSEENVLASAENGSSRNASAFAVGYSVPTSTVPQSLHDQHFKDEDEETPVEENSNNITPIPIQENETVDTPLKPRRRRRVGSDLERLEEGLRRARLTIKEARNGSQLQDPDYVPNGPIYKNGKAFHRSYLEMEKQLKIYVYTEGELPIFHDGPCFGIYSMEGLFINKMEVNKKFRTHDPNKAHVFYLPYSLARMVKYIWEPGMHVKRLGMIVLDYVNVIADKYPYWNRSLGADHFILACHDWGPYTSFYVPDLVKNSIRALCNANTSERFNPKKDVPIPEINIKRSKLQGLIGGPSPSQRTILAFFAGGNHGPVRPILLKHWAENGKLDPDIRVHGYLPRKISYNDLMRQSKYCLCPSGYEVASPRVVEALYNGCVPVLISKSYVPPFSDVLNWESFSVAVPLEDIPNLKKILTSIPERQYIRLQRRGVQVRRHFEVHVVPQRFDVFHMILHSIWLRRLNVRIVGNDINGDMLD